MNILFLCHRIPYPPNKGDKIRSFNELKFLSDRHDISLAFLIDDKKDIQYVDALKKYCKTIDYDVITPSLQKTKSLPCLFSGKPLSVPYFYTERLQKAVDRRLAEESFDVIFAFSSPMAEYVLNSTVNIPESTRLVMDFVDVDSDKWRIYAEHASFPMNLVYRRERKRLMEYEKKVGEQFDVSLFVSDGEVNLYRSFAENVSAKAVPNGVDISYFSSDVNRKIESEEEPVLLFTGAMDYFPNEDAVLYFTKEIWPDIRAQYEKAVFYVVGSNPTKRIRDLAQGTSRIVVTGYVDDIRKYFQHADLFVAPLRIARGIQNKVLEAMASGVAVVASPEAVKGLSVDDQCVQVATGRQSFVHAVVELLKNPEKRDQVVAAAREYIHKNHDWDKNLGCLESVL